MPRLDARPRRYRAITRFSEDLARRLADAAELGQQPPRTKDGRLIVTTRWAKPIPVNNFDWSAITEDYDGAPDAGFQPIGQGATEAEAIADLLEQIEERTQEIPGRP